MPSVFRGAQAQVNRSDLSGRRVWKGAALANWWDPNNVGLSIAGAYRAINSVGTPWGGGPTAYAQTLVNQANPGVNDLVEGNGGVPWVQATGWGFVAGFAQWLDTGLVPANDQSWSMLVQFAPNANNVLALAGSQSGAGNRLALFIDNVGGNRRFYSNGGQVAVAAAVVAANMGVAGAQGFWNGVADGGAIGAWAGASIQDIYIGCYNNGGVAASFYDGDFESIAIYNGGPAAVQAEVAAISAAMGAL